MGGDHRLFPADAITVPDARSLRENGVLGQGGYLVDPW